MRQGRLGAATLAVALWVSLGVALGAQTVHSDHDKKVDFHQFHTYSWAKLSTPNAQWDDRVQQAVNAALQAHGLQEVPSGGQLEVSALGMTRDRHDLSVFYTGGWGFGWGWRGWGGPGIATTSVYTYPVGTLVVDLFDAQTKQLVWRASATDTLSRTDPIKNDEKIDKAAMKMFKDYPVKNVAKKK